MQSALHAGRHGALHALSARAVSVLCALCVLCGSISQANGQSRQVPAPPQQRPVVIVNATIHPVSGPVIERGHVAFRDGVIDAVGAGAMAATPSVEVIDAAGLHVYPGLIAANSVLGLIETGSLPVTIDHTELGRLTPEVRAAVAVNPDSELIPVARANGILTAAVLPRGGAVSGRAAVIRLDGWTWEAMAIDAEAGLVVNWPRAEIISEPWIERNEEQQRQEMSADQKAIERAFDDAAAYLRARENDRAQPTDLRYEAMRSALAGEKPVFITAASTGQIEAAVAWAVRTGVRPVIVGGQQADRCAALLRKHDVPVILGGTHAMPQRRFSAYDEPFTLPQRLHEAGIRFAIASGAEAAHERNLNHNAATAAAYGLPREQALRAVTLSAAEILGLGATHGSLEPGKAATLIVTTGDPLEIVTDTLIAFIDGRRIDLGNRQKALNEKYREKYRQLGLTGEPAPARTSSADR